MFERGSNGYSEFGTPFVSNPASAASHVVRVSWHDLNRCTPMRTRSFLVFLALLGLAAATPTAAQAQIRFGPHLGVNTGENDLVLGLNSQVGVELDNFRFVANPSLDLFLFKQNKSRTRLNLDGLIPVDTGGLELGFGGGVMMQFETIDRIDLPEERKFAVGLNLKGAASYPLGDSSFRLVFEAGLSFSVRNDFTVRSGIVYGLGE